MRFLELALRGRWAEWRGLPADVDLEELIARFGAPVRRTTRRGGRWGECVELPAPRPLTALRVWHRDGEVELVELGDPPTVSTEDALRALGTPERRAPARVGRYGYETVEHVYPERGLVLVVAVAYDHDLPGVPVPDRTPVVAQAELFAPCDLATWRERWGDLSEPGPLPW